MILYRYIIREHIYPFIYALFVITFLFIMDFIVQMIDNILSKGLDPRLVLEMFILNLAWMFALSIPMSVLIAALMAYGRLSSDNEITAMRAAGMNLYRIIFPSFIAALVLGGGLVYFNNNVLPEANHRAAMLYRDVARKRPSAFIREGFIIEDFKGYRIIVGKVDAKQGIMYDVKIFQEEGKNTTLTFARRGAIEYINHGEVIRFVLYDGEIHKEDIEKKGNYFRGNFSKQVIYIDNIDDSFKRSSDKSRGDREMSSQMMLKEIRKYKAEKAAVTRELDTLFGGNMKQTRARVDSSVPAVSLDFTKVQNTAFRRVFEEEKRRYRNLQRRENMILSKDELINKYKVEVHKKYSIPAACPVFILIGAPLGVMARSSGIGVGVAYSIAFFIIYWIFLIGGESLADRLIIPAWAAMWAPNILIGSVGAALIVRMAKEARFISYAWAKRLFRRFFRRPGSATDLSETRP
ncbi:MAG: hypothetical protein A2487_05790 [Candidatus Raymondbacteria bacterium RifOxyC12_full_50_8]|nr:MAG: hypothetical protein A2487_05790 [Candidatus Raymondbacteria bacterium RifOxyC12_full_50_8]